jgi:two-component system chemotaxis response regulator CheB
MARQKKSNRRQQSHFEHEGTPSVFTCPDCQGTLFKVQNDGFMQLRCRTGHTYSPQSMLQAQDENVERLLWAGVRALLEQAEYITQLSSHLKEQKTEVSEELTAKGREAEQNANALRNLITRGTERQNSAREMQTT